MLGKERTKACSKNWCMAGGKESAPINVRMNIDYDQTIKVGFVESNLHSGLN